MQAVRAGVFLRAVVMGLTCRQREPNWQAIRIDYRMNLAGQPAVCAENLVRFDLMTESPNVVRGDLLGN
jgi:hypothetical protein